MQSDTAWHSIAASAACKYWDSDPSTGLTSELVEKRLSRVGPNLIPPPPKAHPIRQLLNQLMDPLVAALLVAAAVAFTVALVESNQEVSWLIRFGDTIAILLIVVLNAILGFVQERKAEAAISALEQMAAPSAKVVRDGAVRKIPARQIVPGDIVQLEAGDAVPADLRIIDCNQCQLEESALSGESLPVSKQTDELPEDSPLADRSNMAYMGTTVVRGKAKAVVVHTGTFTELGKIGALIRSAERTITPLEERLQRFSKQILSACLVISAVLFMIGMVQRPDAWTLHLLTAVSLAVAAIPEGLPAITTITLALGMQRMALRGAIVRKLPAVETLGSATIICSDKTGTLTQNLMTAQVIVTPQEHYDIPTVPLASTHKIDPELHQLLMTATICNSAEASDSDDMGYIGDPTEIALLRAAMQFGYSRKQSLGGLDILEEIPFDGDRKRMTVIARNEMGTTAYVKGSPDVILPRCTRICTKQSTEPLSDIQREAFLAQNEELASKAFRVLAFATKPALSSGDPESDLIFHGFIGMSDPARPEAKAAVKAAQRAGIHVIMITGDHKLTAKAIATELGLWKNDSIALTGQELETIDDQKLQSLSSQLSVFARVTAEQKIRIVRVLKQRGHVVAMTGDGVNDAPALREAQIGVAMGKSGTDVAREASEMVIKDDNFATIIAAIREGRAIFRNIQKSIFFLLSSNAGLVLAVIASAFSDWPQLTPLQLLWINLVTNGLPALALGIDPPNPSQMKEPPMAPESGLLGSLEYWGILLVGALMGISALFLYAAPSVWPNLIPSGSGADAGYRARSLVFTMLAISPLFHAFNCRSTRRSLFRVGWFRNRWLWVAVALSAAVHLITVVVPQLRPIFKTHLPTPHEWLVVLALAALPLVFVEIVKLTGLLDHTQRQDRSAEA